MPESREIESVARQANAVSVPPEYAPSAADVRAGTGAAAVVRRHWAGPGSRGWPPGDMRFTDDGHHVWMRFSSRSDLATVIGAIGAAFVPAFVAGFYAGAALSVADIIGGRNVGLFGWAVGAVVGVVVLIGLARVMIRRVNSRGNGVWRRLRPHDVAGITVTGTGVRATLVYPSTSGFRRRPLKPVVLLLAPTHPTTVDGLVSILERSTVPAELRQR